MVNSGSVVNGASSGQRVKESKVLSKVISEWLPKSFLVNNWRVGFWFVGWNFVNFEFSTLFVDKAEFDSDHLIFGKSACLVRADNSGASKSLHRLESSYNSIVLGHLSSSKSQASGDDSWESFWDSGNSKCDSDFEVVNASFEHSSMNRVREFRIIHNPDKKADDTDKVRELLTKIIDLFLQWRILFFFSCFRDLLLNLTDCCFHSCKDNNTCGTSIADNRGREDHVSLIL